MTPDAPAGPVRRAGRSARRGAGRLVRRGAGRLVRRGAGRLTRRALRRAGYVPAAQARTAPSRRAARPQPVVRGGMVEQFDPDRIVGWVSVAPGSPPVRVALQLGGTDIVTTYATEPTGSREGSDAAGRVSWGEVRPFRILLEDVWTYTRRRDRLVVRAGGTVLPIYRSGMYFSPRRSGSSDPDELRRRLAEGYVFGRRGGLQLSKTVDTVWQQQMMDLFHATRAVLEASFGYQSFFIYGTLLGAVREGGFIGHDHDFDSAYISRHTSGRDAAAELRDIAFRLIDDGYRVECFPEALHITDVAGTKIDLFHLYWDDAGHLAFPYGVSGTTTIDRADWHGLRDIDFPGGTGVVPVDGEQFAEHIYGAGWRQPKPGFSWHRDRTSRARAGALPRDMVEEVYWADFYAHTEYDTGSTFCESLLARDDLPGTVLDIGCGDGRDSFVFGRSGRQVLGVDRSHVGVRHAAKKAAELGLQDTVRFQACDVGHADELRALLAAALDASPDAPVLVYLRFFLHSIPQDVQDTLMDVLAGCVRPGDMLAAEFRTTADQANVKVHERHYRRFQDGPAFGARLRADGYDLLSEQQGTGLSVYRDEDPELYRVVARRG